ncbi:MAG TPA: high-potential iron-sulfur protein [Fodinibius sp.]|nr:high-potential iron-sulfur protein [Fodinibius sp.]
MEQTYSRRKFITRLAKNIAGGCTAFIFGAPLLAGCGGGGEGESSGEESANALDVESCDDLSKVSEAEKKKRQGFGYVEETPMPDKRCDNCNLYTPPEEGRNCGGCILFDGPVFAEAYCTYWAPLES